MVVASAVEWIGSCSAHRKMSQSIGNYIGVADGEVLAEEHATPGEGTWVLQRGRRRFARVTVTPTP